MFVKTLSWSMRAACVAPRKQKHIDHDQYNVGHGIVFAVFMTIRNIRHHNPHHPEDCSCLNRQHTLIYSWPFVIIIHIILREFRCNNGSTLLFQLKFFKGRFKLSDLELGLGLGLGLWLGLGLGLRFLCAICQKRSRACMLPPFSCL